MAKFIKNIDGAVHSVEDDFSFKDVKGNSTGDVEITEKEARELHPALFGIDPDAVEVKASKGAK